MKAYQRCVKTALSERDAWARVHKFRHDGDACHAYRCTECGMWHIGADRKLYRAYGGGMEEER